MFNLHFSVFNNWSVPSTKPSRKKMSVLNYWNLYNLFWVFVIGCSSSFLYRVLIKNISELGKVIPGTEKRFEITTVLEIFICIQKMEVMGHIASWYSRYCSYIVQFCRILVDQVLVLLLFTLPDKYILCVFESLKFYSSASPTFYSYWRGSSNLRGGKKLLGGQTLDCPESSLDWSHHFAIPVQRFPSTANLEACFQFLILQKSLCPTCANIVLYITRLSFSDLPKTAEIFCEKVGKKKQGRLYSLCFWDILCLKSAERRMSSALHSVTICEHCTSPLLILP